MRKLAPIIFLLLCSAFLVKKESTIHPNIDQNSISKGEVLEYKVNFGLFTVGKAQMRIYPGNYNINGRGCYRMDIFGKTSGAVDWVAKVDDNWGAYIDTLSLLPHLTYRKIQENNYRKHEIVKFDHRTNMIEAKVMDKHTGEFKEPEYYQAPDNIRDMIGGFLYLRALDYDSYTPSDTIVIDAFFEDQIYEFAIRYEGKEEVKTKVGDFNAIKLVPIMPDNKIFAGKNSISVWLSDDQNRIPLKVQADMFIGHAGVELISFEGIKNGLEMAKAQ